jgi:hypothetical protein
VLGSATGKLEQALSHSTAQMQTVLETTTGQMDNALSLSTERVQSALVRTTAQLEEVLSSSTDKVHTVLGSTTGEVEAMLGKTTNLLEEALGTTTQKVAGQLSTFTDTAGSESQKAADALRQTQATMILEMQSALEEATRRFNETAAAMRATAREVGTELESTRSELARGVIELPEETKASAAAMRRVVAEQIEALAELNAIVRSQPATHDLSDRRPAPAPERSTAHDEPARPAPSRPEPVRPTPVQPVEVAERTEAPRPKIQAQPEPVVARPTPIRPEPVNGNGGAAAQPAAERSSEGGGWLRDVLRNASTPPNGSAVERPAPATTQENLTSLTDAIARSIDQGALTEAWARYQSGEQNVFSRRIYTLGGQATYDEVRKRLQRDGEFSKTADTYMSEFEQLLQRAAEGTNAVAETREYLLSDRGKVYTMLAHAAGRLS